MKLFFITFILVFVLISLPALFGIGYVIDWIPEATLFQKVKGYVLNGLLNHVLFKTIIACLIWIIVSFVMSKKHLSKTKED